jgi:hypothetical protein
MLRGRLTSLPRSIPMRSAVDLIKRKSSSTLMDFHYVHLGQGMALPLFNSLGCIWRS